MPFPSLSKGGGRPPSRLASPFTWSTAKLACRAAGQVEAWRRLSLGGRGTRKVSWGLEAEGFQWIEL